MSARQTLAAKSWPPISRYANALLGGVIIAGGLALLVALQLGWIDLLPQTDSSPIDEAGQAQTSAQTTIELPPEKFAAADIHTTAARIERLQPTRAVPGEIKYDESRRVPVNAPVEGAILKVLVDPAQGVEKGQELAILSCPQIGAARDAVEKRQADLALARREETRAAEVARNVEELLTSLQQKPKLTEIEAMLERRVLGEYRDRIVSAYSKLVLAERVAGAGDALESGTLSNRLIDERRSSREQAAAQFHGACETAKFAAAQDRDKARAAAEQAQRLLAVDMQSLSNMLGPWGDMKPVSDRDHLSELTLLAPIAGRIVERSAIESTRVTAGAALFTVADTSSMWVSAEIHERDWRSLDFVRQGNELMVQVTALDDQALPAKIRWVGSHVASQTRSVPIVAELPNAEGRLKPGMFVWALVPLDAPRDALVVPKGAIMRHENQPFAFVPDGERTYRRVDVHVGMEERDMIEIVGGLAAGDIVVDRGAFFLKSELLLEREE